MRNLFGSFPPPLMNSTTQEKMITTSLSCYYNDEEEFGAAGTITVDGEYLKLKAHMTNCSFHQDQPLSHISLSLKKPLSCMLHYTLFSNDVRVKFMDTVTVEDKPLLNYTFTHWMNYKLQYGHWRRGYKPSQTMVDASLVINSANKVLMNYGCDTGNCTLTYNHVHKELTTLEPSYDFGKNSWALAVSRRVYGDNTIRASYQRWDKILKFEWFQNSTANRSLKFSASFDLDEDPRLPAHFVESTWSFM